MSVTRTLSLTDTRDTATTSADTVKQVFVAAAPDGSSWTLDLPSAGANYGTLYHRTTLGIVAMAYTHAAGTLVAADLTVLASGRPLVVEQVQTSGGVQQVAYRLLNADGTGGSLVTVSGGAVGGDVDVQVLADGGFIIADALNTAGFIGVFVYNADGSPRTTAPFSGYTSIKDLTTTSLVGGGFALAFTAQSPDQGGRNVLVVRTYSKAGVLQHTTNVASNDTATQLTFPALTALKNGGFALLYEKDGAPLLGMYDVSGALTASVAVGLQGGSRYYSYLEKLVTLANGDVAALAGGKAFIYTVEGVAEGSFSISAPELFDAAVLSSGGILIVGPTPTSAGERVFNVFTPVRTSTGDRSANTFAGDDLIDVMTGGAASDTFAGGGGDNLIDGGDGVDTAVYAGILTQYAISVAADGSVHVTSTAGAPDALDDTLTHVEALQFADRVVDLVVEGSLSVAQGASVTLISPQTYSGKTQISGELDLAAGGLIASSSQVALKASGAVFDISGAGAGGAMVTIQELSGVTGSSIRLGAGALSLTETTAATYAGAIGDGGVADGVGGALVVNGTAALTLSGANTYTGKTQIYGQLDLAGSAVLNTSKAVTLKSASAVFDISQATGKEAILNLAGVAGSHIYLGANTLKINHTTAAIYAGVISDGGAAGGTGGALIVKGTVPLTLTGANTFTGGVTLQTGTLELASTTAAGVGHALTFAGAATLQLDAGALGGSGGQQSYGTAIKGFAASDHIDLASLAYASDATAAYSGSTLTVTSGGSQITLTVESIAAGATFAVADDGHGHVLVGLVGG